MKHIFIVIVTIIMWYSCSNPKIIKYPIAEKFENLIVHQIELTDTATILHAAIYGHPGNKFQLEGDKQNGTCFLESRETGKKYNYRGLKELESGKTYTLNRSEVLFMKLHFDPIAPEEKIVDLYFSKII